MEKFARILHNNAIKWIKYQNDNIFEVFGSIYKRDPILSKTPYPDNNFKFLPPSTACPVSSVTVSGKEHIHVSQIKKEEAFPNSYWIWTVADNLTLGSALNAYEIAQNMLYRSS